MKINIRNMPQQKAKLFTIKLLSHTFTLVLLAITSLLMVSCEEEEPHLIMPPAPLALTASASNLELNQRNFNQNALTFSWTTGTNHGTNTAIDYTLQLGKKGDNFASPLNVELGRVKYSNSYRVDDLNDLLVNDMQLMPGTASEIEARIMSVAAAASMAPDYSNAVSLTVTPYEKVSETLYLIGDATPNGWDSNNATPLIADDNAPTRFTYQGALNPGEFKFITTLGSFLPSYQKGADNTKIVLRTTDDQPDDKFIIAEAGVYSIMVDLLDLTIAIEKGAQAPYSELWIVGDATPNGWNIDNPNEMVQDPVDPFIFTYNEVLKAGEFKIATAKNWDAPFYRPVTNHPDLSETAVQLSAGDPDNKWKITTAGAYKIQLDLRTRTISIQPFQPYARLWMVGDATPNGWNIDAPNEMVADPANPFVFTYTGALKAGEFKIPTATGDWGTDYFMPPVNHPEITSTAVKFIPGGNPDNKWQITEAGDYTITLNQLYHTITIQKN